MSCLSSPLLFYLTAWSEGDDTAPYRKSLSQNHHNTSNTAYKLCVCHSSYMLCWKESSVYPNKLQKWKLNTFKSDVWIIRQMHFFNAGVVWPVSAISILSSFKPACLIVGLMLDWCWATLSLRQTAPFSSIRKWGYFITNLLQRLNLWNTEEVVVVCIVSFISAKEFWQHWRSLWQKVWPDLLFQL